MSDEPPTSSSTQRAPTRPRASAKPRAGIQRKTKAEREEYAKKEAERAKERETSESTPGPKPQASRGRGAARGSRAGATGIRSDRTSSTVTSGVFGAGSGLRPERTRSAVDVGVSEALDGGHVSASATVSTNTKAPTAVRDVEPTESKAGVGRGRPAKTQTTLDQVVQIDEDLEDQPRRDIERIWISSDEDDIVAPGSKGKRRRVSRTPKHGSVLRPVRAARENAEDSLKQAQSAADIEGVVDIDSDDMQHDTNLTSKKDLLSGPETTRRALKKTEPRQKEPRGVAESVESRAERLRLQDDVEHLREAFLTKSDTDDGSDSKQDDSVLGRSDHDRMFLFQFPPLVPQLRRPASPVAQDAESMDVDQVQVKVEDATAAANTSKDKEKDKANNDQSLTTFAADASVESRLPQGYVGKLRVHKSGKVTLDWGGTNMEVRYGTEVDFLQDVVSFEEKRPTKTEEDDQDGLPSILDDVTGQVYALGQLDRKMVVIPDWSRLYA